MNLKTGLVSFCCLALACHHAKTIDLRERKHIASESKDNPYPNIHAIPLPEGYRIKSVDNGFAKWLTELPLKKSKTVFLYNGTPKANQDAQFAVVDISTGQQDLQQCADAVMRLRAEYLFAQQRFEEIEFTDNAGTRYQFSEPYTTGHLQQYLQRVFGMCGSASLAKQLKPTNWQQLKAGDVLIRGGFPGHAAMVMEVATNATGETIYLLAQSYMPAQDIHLLKNPMNTELSPWYKVSDAASIYTPEYRFQNNELKQW